MAMAWHPWQPRGYARGWLDGEGRDAIHRRYGSGIAIAARDAGTGTARLLALPARRELEIDGRQVLLCHGSAWDPDHYVYPDAADEERRRMASERPGPCCLRPLALSGDMAGRKTTIVNPGSVGQPRDRKPGACWALWDIAHHGRDAEEDRIRYAAVAERARRIDPHLPYLADVLTRQ